MLAVSARQLVRNGSSWGQPSERQRAVWLAGAIAAVVLIMVAHYWTDVTNISLHNVYRRLAYVPIVVAAFAYGLKGGVLTSVAACLAYLPHAFFAHHQDPSPAIDKAFEMVLYVFIGGLTGYLVNRRDQVRRALERSLLERDALEKQLVRAGRMSALGQMTAGLAHEIRNPLASILGSAEAIVADLDEGHRKYELGRVLISEVDRLNRVVGDFVRFGRPNPPERADVDLVGLAHDVVALAQTEADKRSLEMTVEKRPPLAVEADRDQISQVILNLLLNACQAMDPLPTSDASDSRRGGRVRVRFDERDIAGRPFVGVGVEDDGPGIPTDEREAIFTPFVSGRPDGSGLGLAVSNRIVDAHDGFMEVESEEQPGDGPATTVWFYLPAGSDTP